MSVSDIIFPDQPLDSAPLQLVLLDLDGTLVEPEHEFVFAEIERFFLGCGITPPERSSLEHAARRGAVWEWLPAEGREELVAKFWSDYRRHLYPHPRVLDSAVAALNALRSTGLKTAVVTFRSQTSREVSAILEPTGLLAHLDAVYSMGELANTAPDKSPIITRALNDFGVQACNTCIVGDAAPDIRSGRACNLRYAIAVETGGMTYDYLASLAPDYILSHISELPALLHSVTRRHALAKSKG